MASGGKRADGDIEAFFAGVNELRAHLDRHLQDPARRLQRLSRAASTLLKPRPPRELCGYLLTELGEAIGASGGVVLVRERRDQPFVLWQRLGSEAAEPWLARLDELLRARHSLAPEPLVVAEGVLVPLVGGVSLLGAVGLSGPQALDEATGELLGAIAGAAGMALEHGLILATLA